MSSRWLDSDRVELAARWLLGGAFLAASIHKVIDPSGFAKVLFGYDLLPGIVINLTAILLPFMELVAGVCLLAGVFPRSAAKILSVLLVFFTAAVAYNWSRGYQFDCGCFSTGTTDSVSSPPLTIGRNLLLLACAWLVIRFRGEPLFQWFPSLD
ncbi:MAG: MauE/DoxX family redox-associated membrane protein [Desulfobacterales bacterium]